MRFELTTGWRYLSGERRDRIMRQFALICLAISIAGGVIIAATGGSALGVAMLVLGLLATALFALLSMFSIFTSMSVFGVTLGVAALTVVIGVTTGFQQAFRDKVLGVNAHVIVRDQVPIADYRTVIDHARRIDPDVIAVQPFIYAEVLVTRGKGELSGIGIKGIDPELAHDVLDLDRHIQSGSIDDLQTKPGELPGLLVGNELAHKLHTKVGDTLTIVMPFSNFDSSTRRFSAAPRTRKFVVKGIFHCGFDEYDRRLVYASLAETQALVGQGDIAFGVELRLADVERAEEIADTLERDLGGTYEVLDWHELNQSLFTAVALQKIVLTLILTLIIVVAAVNMVSSLQMMVTDKTREIAILKSMGAKTGSVGRIFQLMGLVIGGIGTTLGVAIGLVTCEVVLAYGYPLDPQVYMIDRLPIVIRPFEVLAIIGLTLLISLLSTLVPARAAASLSPVDGLRYD
ncbi:MAG TPA: ABC transporter permease [Kofleriaceae bacterium]|nr:ABC transporter permease [Kofleriaceae bacterium]